MKGTKRRGHKSRRTRTNTASHTASPAPPTPRDARLYAMVKSRVYTRIPKHSAYRSGTVVSEYKVAFAKKYGGRRSPYIGKRKRGTARTGLTRWFAEDWRNQRGEVGYKHKNDVYRPTHRITRKTPMTMKEVGRRGIRRARTQKYRKGRVKKF